MSFQAVTALMGLAFLAFVGFFIYFVFKQLQFVIQAINLYKKMVTRQDTMIVLLRDIRALNRAPDKAAHNPVAQSQRQKNTNSISPVKKKATSDLYAQFTDRDPVSEEEILKELERSSQISDHSPLKLDEKKGSTEQKKSAIPKDRRKDKETIGEEYINIKDKIFEEIKSAIKKPEESKILSNLARLDYADVRKLIDHPEDLTETGARVLSILKHRIESNIKQD